MTYQEYQIAASRTCVSLDSEIKNMRHMRMGVYSEFGEIIDIYKKELAYGKTIDRINLAEEWADKSWYIANEANRLNVIISEDFQSDFTTDRSWIEDIIFDFIIFFRDIQDYSHLRLDNEKKELINQVFHAWVWIGKELFHIDTNKALENNIAKLKARYPEKFTQEAALNRNLDAERKELSKGL